MSDLPKGFTDALTQLYGPPKGKFLTGTHGMTYYMDEGPPGGPVVVLAHGLGTKLDIWDGPVMDSMLALGFRVIRYSFHGHHWSRANADTKWDEETYVTQAEELLDFLLKPGQVVKLWVGHSLGGVLGVLLAQLHGRAIEDFALVAPAFWVNKPLIARLGEKVPSTLEWIAGFKSLEFLARDAYIDNWNICLAKEGDEYIRKDLYESGLENIKEMFRLHPQVSRALVLTNCWLLRGDLLEEYRLVFQQFVEERAAGRIGLVWGTEDQVVPFEQAYTATEWNENRERIWVVELPRVGHECVVEDQAVMAKALADIARGCRK